MKSLGNSQFFYFWVVCLSILFSGFGTKARWMKPSEAPFEILQERTVYSVEKDGSYSQRYFREHKILTEQAREANSLVRFNLGSHESEFRLIRAETRLGRERLPVDLSLIEMKPVASSGPGFTEEVQVTIPFPKVAVGAILVLEFELKVLHPLVPGSFSYVMSPGYGVHTRKYEVEVESALPLFTEIHDPRKAFRVQNRDRASAKMKASDMPYRVKVSLSRPLFESVAEEPNFRMNPKDFSWVGITTLANWSALPDSTVISYEAQLSALIPAKFQSLLSSLRRMPKGHSQIDALTSGVSDLVRYVGDWRLVNHSHHPRALEEIARTGYGDCKDFSVLVGALLRSLGYEVSVAWVGRGVDWLDSPLSLAIPRFNHAIVRVHFEGRDLWLDPTNTISFSKGIYSDIADREALVLSPHGKSFITRTPPIPFEQNWTKIKTQINVAGESELRVRGESSLSEAAALAFQALQVTQPEQNVKYSLLSFVTDPSRISTWNVDMKKTNSRVAAPLNFSFNYVSRSQRAQTQLGNAFVILSSWVTAVDFETKDRVSDFLLGTPFRSNWEIELFGRPLLEAKPLKCAGDSPWFTYHREFLVEPHRALVRDGFTIKVSQIPRSEFTLPEFAKAVRDLRECLRDLAILERS